MLYRTAVTDASGRFTIKGVAPGEYTAIDWEDIHNTAWRNGEDSQPQETIAE
jgi:hypothetical protein